MTGALGMMALGAAGLGTLVTARLAYWFLRDPARGLVLTTHRAEALPRVMADRYVAFTLLGLGAVLYRDLAVIAALFAVFSYMAFHDAWIYAQGGHSTSKHLIAGGAAAFVAVLALVAIAKTGAAA